MSNISSNAGQFFCPTFVSFFLKTLYYYSNTIFHHSLYIMHLTSKIVDFLFPRQCISCWILGAYLCRNCKRELKPHPEICPICHRFSKDYQKCINCRTTKNFFLEGIIIPFVYDDLLKRLILKLKYFHKKDIGGFLVDRLAIALQANESFQRDFHHSTFTIQHSTLYISFIPTHRYREYFVKGYNQSKILCEKLSEKTNIPRLQIAKKQKHTKTQASLNREWRLKNLKNAFSLLPNLPLKGDENILIVDDITTTGSTINELAKLIKFHYPKIKVRWAVLWRHIG